jgi:hypothetical protein
MASKPTDASMPFPNLGKEQTEAIRALTYWGGPLAKPMEAAAAASELVSPESEPRRVRTEVEPPFESSCGMIVEGTYVIADGETRVRDMEGRLFTERLGPDDPAVVARRLLRAKYGKHSDFYAPIRYPTTSYGRRPGRWRVQPDSPRRRRCAPRFFRRHARHVTEPS